MKLRLELTEPLGHRTNKFIIGRNDLRDHGLCKCWFKMMTTKKQFGPCMIPTERKLIYCEYNLNDKHGHVKHKWQLSQNELNFWLPTLDNFNLKSASPHAQAKHKFNLQNNFWIRCLQLNIRRKKHVTNGMASNIKLVSSVQNCKL